MTEGLKTDENPLKASDLPFTADHPILVVHFWASWDGTEHLFAPNLETVRAEFEDRITFRSANVEDDELAEFVQECEVNNVPALGCFKDGRLVKTVIGYRTVDALRLEIAALLGEAVTPNQMLQQIPPLPLGFLG
jgi:thioredoxin 1